MRILTYIVIALLVVSLFKPEKTVEKTIEKTVEVRTEIPSPKTEIVFETVEIEKSTFPVGELVVDVCSIPVAIAADVVGLIFPVDRKKIETVRRNVFGKAGPFPKTP